VLLPRGFAFLSSNVAAQVTTTADGLLKLAFANPNGQSNPVAIHARKSSATFPPRHDPDMFFDDIRTLYDLGAPDSGSIRVEQTYSDYRKGDKAQLSSLAYLALQDLKVVDLDTAKVFAPARAAPRRSSSSTCPSSTTSRARTSDRRHAERPVLQGRERRPGLRARAARPAQHGAAARGLG
jgi:hypothetical protein